VIAIPTRRYIRRKAWVAVFAASDQSRISTANGFAARESITNTEDQQIDAAPGESLMRDATYSITDDD